MIGLGSDKNVFWPLLTKTRQDQALIYHVQGKIWPHSTQFWLRCFFISQFFGTPCMFNCSGILMQSRRGRNEKQYVASMFRYHSICSTFQKFSRCTNFGGSSSRIFYITMWQSIKRPLMRTGLPLDHFLANIIIMFIRWLLLRCDVLTMGDVPMLLRRWLTSAANMLIKVSNYPNETSIKLSKL